VTASDLNRVPVRKVRCQPLRWVRALVAWVACTPWFRRYGPRIVPRLEAITRRLTGGRITVAGLLVPALTLHSVGARSGLARDTELMCVPDGDTWLVTGSNFAGANHPAWTYNLLAHPAAEITYRRRRRPVYAEPVADQDREAVWAYIERQWPGYRGYERASGRTLRIFRLRPR